MPALNAKAAYDYYAEHIHRQPRFDLLKEHNFEVAGSIPPIDWELFGALLTGDDRKEGYGSDLKQHEVKSAVEGSSFEYQYHKHGGLAKLEEDKNVDHIFVSYSPDYKRVTVRLINRTILGSKFESWREGLIQNYDSSAPKQRYRKSIAHGTVVAQGEIVFKIEDSQLVLPAAAALTVLEPPG